jgi:hypothetical protein
LFIFSGIIIENAFEINFNQEDKVMKARFVCVFFLVLILQFVLFSRTAELEIRMFDNTNMIVVLGDYQFDENRGRYHISDLSAGYYNMEVYRKPNSLYGQSGISNAQLFYRGNIHLPEGYLTYAEVTPSGRLEIVKRVSLHQTPHYGGSHHHNSGSYGHPGGYYGHGHSYGYAGMEPRAFDELKYTIRNTSFDRNKLDIAKFAASRNRLTSFQVTEIIHLFSFESNKLDFAKYAYGFVADPGSYFMVANAFTFSSSKRELYRYIGYPGR